MPIIKAGFLLQVIGVLIHEVYHSTIWFIISMGTGKGKKSQIEKLTFH